MQGRRGWVRTTGVAVVAAAVLAGACTDSADTATTTTAVTATSTTVAPDEAAVLAAYRAFWDAYLAAADPMDPSHPALARHAASPELGRLQRAFLARRAAGEVIRGTLDLAPTIVRIDDTTAAVRDCYLDSAGIYDAGTGKRKDTPTGVRHQILVTLTLEHGIWKVRDIDKEADGCVPA